MLPYPTIMGDVGLGIDVSLYGNPLNFNIY